MGWGCGRGGAEADLGVSWCRCLGWGGAAGTGSITGLDVAVPGPGAFCALTAGAVHKEQ